MLDKFSDHLKALLTGVVVWSAAMTYMYETGLLWHLLSAQFQTDQRFLPQALMMKRVDLMKGPLAIGDSAFIAAVQKAHRDDTPLHTITVQAIDTDDLKAVIQALHLLPRSRGMESGFCKLIFQNAPYFLTRMKARGTSPNLEYLKGLSKHEFPLFPNNSTRQFFHTVKLWATTKNNPVRYDRYNRPPSFPPPLSQPDRNLENWHALKKQLGYLKIPAVAVADRRFVDYSGAPNVLNYFNQEFPGVVSQTKIKNGSTLMWAEISDLTSKNLLQCKTARSE